MTTGHERKLETLQLAFALAPVGLCVSRDRVVDVCNVSGWGRHVDHVVAVSEPCVLFD